MFNTTIYDCFVSFSSTDRALADAVASQLRGHGLSVFLAPMSIAPGDDWAASVKAALNGATWVLVLASRAACRSPFVLQEAGAAIFGRKKLVPVIWDLRPQELPGWLSRYQALDLRSSDPSSVAKRVAVLAKFIGAKKREGAVVAGAVLASLIGIALMSGKD